MRNGEAGKKVTCIQKCVYVMFTLVLFVSVYVICVESLFENFATTKRQMPPSQLPSDSDTNKYSMLQSKWIKLFPNLRQMATQVSDPIPLSKITSADRTVISLEGSSNFTVGGTITAFIKAADKSGRRKLYGGDFFLVTLRRPSPSKDGVSCEVYDEMNGSYRVTCILLWPGETILHAVLLHPSESIYQMMKWYSSETEYGVLMNNTMVNSKGIEEYVYCSIGFSNKKSDELCDYTNFKYGEPWKCIKPASGECLPLTWQNDKKPEEKLTKFFDNAYFRKKVNFNASIQGTEATFHVNESTAGLTNYLHNKTPSVRLNPMVPSGWFYDSKWISNQVDAASFSVSKAERCLTNTDIYFIGDSTIRQWYEFFVEILNVKDFGPDNSVVKSHSRNGVHKKINASLHYRAHGPPLHNVGPPQAKPYMTYTLDNIKKGGNGTIIIITLGYHYELYDPDIFANRVQTIKIAIISLLKRLPGTMVYIKGLHYQNRWYVLCPTPWLAYRFEVMFRHEFENVKGIVYVPFWDFTVLIENELIHPEYSVLKKEMGYFLSYLC